jgi:hypothetical protein
MTARRVSFGAFAVVVVDTDGVVNVVDGVDVDVELDVGTAAGVDAGRRSSGVTPRLSGIWGAAPEERRRRATCAWLFAHAKWSGVEPGLRSASVGCGGTNASMGAVVNTSALHGHTTENAGHTG